MINVDQATPTITWANPADIIYGTALGASRRTASWTPRRRRQRRGPSSTRPASGTPLRAGNNQTLSVTFTPTDTTDYSTATATATINVDQATPTITWANPADITYGTAPGQHATGRDGQRCRHASAYTPAGGTVLDAGNNQTLVGHLHAHRHDRLQHGHRHGRDQRGSGHADDHLGEPGGHHLRDGALGAQLDATASAIVDGDDVIVEGTFIYSPASGAVLPVGQQSLSVTFTPTDTFHYHDATGATTIHVDEDPPTIVAVASVPNLTTIDYSVTGMAGLEYIVEFYAGTSPGSPTAEILGTTQVMLSSTGTTPGTATQSLTATFNLATALQNTQAVTGTVSDSNGNDTSPLSTTAVTPSLPCSSRMRPTSSRARKSARYGRRSSTRIIAHR